MIFLCFLFCPKAADRRGGWSAAPAFSKNFLLHALPLCAAGHVGHFDTLRLELVADAVSLGKILRLLGLRALADQVLDALVRRAVLRDDREAARALLGRGLLLLLALGFGLLRRSRLSTVS